MRRIASKNPKRGEIKSEAATSDALLQLTAASPVPGSKLYATPQPKMDPTKVCVLEHGIPKSHVPRFQKIAVSKIAPTMLKLWAVF